MRLEGKVWKEGKFWIIEVPMLDVVTQGHTKKEAFLMIADAIESLVNKDDFKINVYPQKKEYFEIDSNDLRTFCAFLLKRLRIKRGMTLADVAERLGSKSLNSYARYEQGRAIPTIEKFNALLTAVSPGNDFLLVPTVKH